MPYTVVDKSSLYFNTVTYTGDGASTKAITVGFQPDFVWIKDRTTAYDHHLFDAVRGGGNSLYSNDSVVENTYTTDITFDSNGFTTAGVGSAAILYVNKSGDAFASWNWKANGSGSSNTAGSITSTVSANTTSGFSIVSYTGNATAGATVGHGLGVVPKMIILKRRTGSAEDWYVYHGSLANTEVLRLNLNNAKATRADFNNTRPTSSVFTINSSDNVNASGSPFIAYCFADVKGFSKFGSFTGNGSTDGTFVYTGFTPAFVILKNSTTGLTSWETADNKRGLFNVNDKTLKAETFGAEQTYNFIDFLSNGFKLRYSSDSNTSGNTIIYIAFASSPFVSSKGIPATAK